VDCGSDWGVDCGTEHGDEATLCGIVVRGGRRNVVVVVEPPFHVVVVSCHVVSVLDPADVGGDT
jgi:hypothetical protein